MSIISKELLIEVLHKDISYIDGTTDNELSFIVNTSLFPMQFINMYELAYKCKEWALNEGYRLESSTFLVNQGKPYCAVVGYIRTQYCANADSELEAIFKACEWILQQRTTNV